MLLINIGVHIVYIIDNDMHNLSMLFTYVMNCGTRSMYDALPKVCSAKCKFIGIYSINVI